jgi:hypothetical protein
MTGQMVHPPRTAGETRNEHRGNGPVLLLSYAHSGAERVQEILAAGTRLACTSGTGIIPQCASAAEAWRQVENRDDQLISHLAVSTVRTLVSAQITAILASTGKASWCELTTATPQTLAPFLQVFPHTAILCVHHRCPDVIAATVQASPWGLGSPGLTPYLLSYPGNSVASIAAYWANVTEELLAFEKANPANTRRIRLEDMMADPATALTTVRDWLKLTVSPPPALPQHLEPPRPDPHPPLPPADLMARMIPPALHQRVNRLHAELGYPSLDSAC